MLHIFLAKNRSLLIDRCRSMVAGRSMGKAPENDDAHGIPTFLIQLVKALSAGRSHHVSDRAEVDDVAASMSEVAALHGRELYEQGFSLEQVVREYGDLCQAVTNLAFETGLPIEVDEFRTLNRCLDDAVASAVTEHARQSAVHEADDAQSSISRFGAIAHEMRNHLQTITLVVKAIKTGSVGISGATGAVLDRSILGMRHLVDQSLADVRLTAKIAPSFQVIPLGGFLSEVEASASLDAQARGLRFSMGSGVNDLAVYADPDMLFSAVRNLLQNAFKFTMRHSDVRLHAYSVADRVLINVEDRCGGLAGDGMDRLFLPFVQGNENRSGLGLGLDICKRNIEANNGSVRVKNLPGSGCIFTIDLPRYRNGSSALAPIPH